ncbi:MAG: Hsp20/alpha crystallin family protein [Verrucomicrobiales bacterium]
MMKSNRFNQPPFGFGSGLGRLIQDAFDGLEDLGGILSSPGLAGQAPKADLYEDADHFYVTLELPGVKKTDVKVELNDGLLKVGASLSRETEEGRKNIPLKRSIRLPDEVGTGEVKAKLEDGLLTITLPKLESAKPRSITID